MSQQDVVVDLCDGRLQTSQVPPGERAEDLADFVNTYASFEAETPGGAVRFTGNGTAVATPAEQRMIAEWAHLRVFETTTGRGVDELVLAWHRKGGVAASCDDLKVYLTGRVVITSCKGGQTEEPGPSRLTAEQLAQFYAWLDGLRSFETDQPDLAAADGRTVRLVFSGMGTQTVTPADLQAMLDLVATLVPWALQS